MEAIENLKPNTWTLVGRVGALVDGSDNKVLAFTTRDCKAGFTVQDDMTYYWLDMN